MLGISGPPGKKALWGSTFHKIMEILANIKLSEQKEEEFFEDDVVGYININNYSLPLITDKIYEYYSNNYEGEWTDKTHRMMHKWVNKLLDFNDGQYDPRNLHIVDVEKKFDMVLDYDWAHYEYILRGEKVEGQLALKGTIDLITRDDDNTIHIIDWKSGQNRQKISTGETKEYKHFKEDFQLRLYHYVVHQLYDVDVVYNTIFWLNKGGPFTIHFDKEDLKKTEEMIKDKFEYIKASQKPTNIRKNKRLSWFCQYCCAASKLKFQNAPIEYRDKQTTPIGEKMDACCQIQHELESKNVDELTEKYIRKDFSPDYYQSPT